ncbi:hypothetical protein L6452_16348 [Arctium lappa]|uniref:Uncharacterized protein n=1 Tax=Arctium lappa TaxID=4217 RepID=A0ACB9C0F9_ARCLA|nr:hypothetical protein L6452_16348 [Arctium lappa]
MGFWTECPYFRGHRLALGVDLFLGVSGAGNVWTIVVGIDVGTGLSVDRIWANQYSKNVLVRLRRISLSILKIDQLKSEELGSLVAIFDVVFGTVDPKESLVSKNLGSLTTWR